MERIVIDTATCSEEMREKILRIKKTERTHARCLADQLRYKAKMGKDFSTRSKVKREIERIYGKDFLSRKFNDFLDNVINDLNAK